MSVLHTDTFFCPYIQDTNIHGHGHVRVRYSHGHFFVRVRHKYLRTRTCPCPPFIRTLFCPCQIKTFTDTDMSVSALRMENIWSVTGHVLVDGQIVVRGQVFVRVPISNDGQKNDRENGGHGHVRVRHSHGQEFVREIFHGHKGCGSPAGPNFYFTGRNPYTFLF